MNHNGISSREYFIKQNMSLVQSYKIVHKIATRGKPVADINFFKECMMEADRFALMLETISISASSVVRRTWRDKNVLWYF